jgi:hypothetical protein
MKIKNPFLESQSCEEASPPTLGTVVSGHSFIGKSCIILYITVLFNVVMKQELTKGNSARNCRAFLLNNSVIRYV